MEIIHLTDSNFEEEVISSSIPVLVDFWAEWCAPCLMVAPILEELVKEYEGKVKIAKLNVDENLAKASTYRIMNIPNMKIFKDGKIVNEIIGAVPKEVIKKKLDAIL